MRRYIIGAHAKVIISQLFYFVNTTVNYKQEPLHEYLDTPNISEEEINSKFTDYFNPEKITIAIMAIATKIISILRSGVIY